jgi:hypothetical protein
VLDNPRPPPNSDGSKPAKPHEHTLPHSHVMTRLEFNKEMDIIKALVGGKAPSTTSGNLPRFPGAVRGE